MYHTALLQNFNGTKHIAAGEKAIKITFLKIYHYKLHKYSTFANSAIQIASIQFFKKLPTVLETPEDKAAV